MTSKWVAKLVMTPRLSDSKCHVLVQLKIKQTKTSATGSSSRPPARAKWLRDIFKREEGTLASRLFGCQADGAGESRDNIPSQIVRYLMPIDFYQRLWKSAGARIGKEKGRKGR